MFKKANTNKAAILLALLFSLNFAFGQNDSTWIHSYIKLKTNWNHTLERLEFRTCLANDPNNFDVLTNTFGTRAPIDSVETLLVINGDTIVHFPNTTTFLTGALGDTINIYFKAIVNGFPVNSFPDYEFSAKIANDFLTPSIAYLIQPDSYFFNLPLSLLQTKKNTGSTNPCNGNMDLNLTGGYPFSANDPYEIRWDILNSDYNEYQDSLCAGTIRYQFHDNWFGCTAIPGGTFETTYSSDVCNYAPYFCEEEDIEMSSCNITLISDVIDCSSGSLMVDFITTNGAIEASYTSPTFMQPFQSNTPTIFSSSTNFPIELPSDQNVFGVATFADGTVAQCNASTYAIAPYNIEDAVINQVYAECDETSAVVNWQQPFVAANYSFNISSNHMSGESFPIGNTQVVYTFQSGNCIEERVYEVVVLPSQNCNCISGSIICSDSTPLVNAPINILGLPYELTVFTDNTGFYSYCNDSIDFSLLPPPTINQNWMVSNGYAGSVYPINTGSNGTSANWNLETACGFNPCLDLSTQVSPWIGYYQGTTATINLNTWGYSSFSAIEDYQLTLSIPSGVTINGTIPSGGILTGNTITWNLNETSSFFSLYYILSFDIPTGIQDGDVHLFSATITPITHDECNQSDNHSCIAFIVGNSYDPNDKTVDLGTYIGEDVDDVLTYTVTFQNTGTAPAQTVYILDTLSSLLDWSTFEVVGHSHDMVVTKQANGVVKFEFPSIWLPTETANEPMSHGYVSYRIKENEGNVLYSEVNNTAYIYFDENEPITTSTTSNINNRSKVGVKNLEQNTLATYPNPVIDNLTVTSKGTILEIRITDAQGRIVQRVNCNKSTVEMNFSSYASGVYTLSILDESNSWINKKVIKK